MTSDQTVWIILIIIGVAVALALRRVIGMNKRAAQVNEEAMVGMKKRLALDEEILALNHKQVAQGEETIALLKSLNENLKNRT